MFAEIITYKKKKSLPSRVNESELWSRAPSLIIRSRLWKWSGQHWRGAPDWQILTNYRKTHTKRFLRGPCINAPYLIIIVAARAILFCLITSAVRILRPTENSVEKAHNILSSYNPLVELYSRNDSVPDLNIAERTQTGTQAGTLRWNIQLFSCIFV